MKAHENGRTSLDRRLGFFFHDSGYRESFLCGLHEVYSHTLVSPDLFIYLFIYLSTRVEHLSRGPV